ncbi:MAG TPA: DHH family phosphoesterase, partial [Candidatus Brocadiia bacterium]|nr:DHH family phosphoesterase [Candidatus Brocadiia bacterium]
MGVPQKTRRNVRRLRELLVGRKTMLIAMQDHPDPDAVAAAGALRAIANSVGGIACSLAHGGIIGRAENRALVRYLGLNLRPLEALAAERFDLVALVDTQPGTGNNSLAPHAKVDIIFDHHATRPASVSAPFRDIRRRYGATSTILYEYMQALGVAVDAPLATALCYGIRSDTQDLERDTTQ